MARDEEESSGIIERLFGEGEGRAPLVLAGVILVFAAVATSFLWSRFRGEVLSGAGFRLTEDSFEVTQQPPWIAATNVTSEAMVSGNLGALNLRQPDLTVRVGQAFAMHPWIRKVNHVTKRYPSRILVDVAYRQPVAMVEVTVMQQGRREAGRLPVDGEGILLPTADFTQESADTYLRIAAGETTPVSRMSGTAWGDDRVHEAARVAGFLRPYQSQLDLFRIVAYRGPTDGAGGVSNYFVVHTKSNTSIIWGRAPGMEQSGEPGAEQKMARLREYAAKHGGLVTERPGQSIDVRRAAGLQVAELGDEVSISR